MIEVIDYRRLYDIDNDEFYASFKADVYLNLNKYEPFLNDLAHFTSYSSMLTVLALSSVIQRPIQTVWPIQLTPGVPPSLSKLVMGCDVTSAKNPIYIMWTAMSFDDQF